MLAERIVAIKRELVEYAGIIESMMRSAMQGLVKKDKTLLEAVINEYEPKVNSKELIIDDLCTSFIAQFEPRAKDLRTILMILKMNNDLERMGDHMVNITESALFLIERPLIDTVKEIPVMGEKVSTMLHDSIQAFINEDAELAKKVCEADDVVDNLHEKNLRDLITNMSKDQGTIERALHVLRISSNLERVADLSTNIGEDVLFMVQGRIIKHHREDLL